MPMIDMPATPVSGAAMVIERRVGEAGNRGLSPVLLGGLSPVSAALARQKNAVMREVYVYEPTPGYLGKDRFEVLVPVGGETVRVLYFVHVQPLPTENDVFDSRRYCPKSDWKISTDLNSTGGRSNWGLTSIDLPPNDSAVGLSDLPFRRSVS